MATISGLVFDFLGSGTGAGFRAAIGWDIGEGFFVDGDDTATDLPSPRVCLLATFFASATTELGFFPPAAGLVLPAGLFDGGTIFATEGFVVAAGLPDGFEADLASEREDGVCAAAGFAAFLPVLAGAKAADFDLTTGLAVVVLALLADSLEPSDFCFFS